MVNGILMVLATVAACMDLVSERIDNRLILFGWVLGLGYQIGHLGSAGIPVFLVGALAPVLLLYLLFYFRMLGAGDIKLFSVLGGFMGPAAILKCVAVSFILGAVLSVGFVLVCGNLMSRLWYFANYLNRVFTTKKVIPYYLPGKRMENIHFSIPILMGVMIYTGGFYS